MRRTVIALIVAVMLSAGIAAAQGASIRVKPPGALATISRRPPDFSRIRFLGMQRDYRKEIRGELLIGNQALRMGRPVAPMKMIEWPPSSNR